MNRKDFIKLLGVASSAMVLPQFTHVNFKSGDPQIQIFDLHSHPGIFFTKGEDRFPGNQVVEKTVNDMNNSGVVGAFFSLVADTPLLIRTDKGITYERTFQKGEAWAEFKRQVKVFKEFMNSLETRFATKSSELNGNGNVAAYMACEGGDFIEEIDMLDEAYDDGLRSVQIVHYVPNHLGDLQTAEPLNNGLSKMGKDVVRRMNKLGMVIDVAHASEKTVQDVVETSDSPIILSHSILKMEEDRPIAARAITENHAKLIAANGGVIGMWPSGFSKSFDEFVNSTLRMVEVVGIDHVGMGTDMDANYKPVINNYSQLPDWVNALKEKGMSEEEVEKIAWKNAERVLKQVLKS